MKIFSKKTKVLFLVGCVFQFMITWILCHMARPAEALQIQFTFTHGSYIQLINGWSPHDVSTYLSHYYLDYIYPFIYALFFVSITSDLKFSPVVQWLGPIAGAFDLIENTFHIFLIKQVWPNETFFVSLAAGAANIKWFLILVLIILIIANLGQGLKKSF
ncbi:MAG: hypothetical protein ACXWQQ_06790 [Pseudobdellovibrio sp.]